MYTKRDELLDDVAEMWREKEVEKDQEKGGKADSKALEVERQNAAVGMRTAAVVRPRETRSATAAAIGQPVPPPRPGQPPAMVEPPRKRLDVHALIAQRQERRQQELDMRWEELELAKSRMANEAAERRLMLSLLREKLE